MRSSLDRVLVIVSVASALAGCVESFSGSNVQIDFAPGVREEGTFDPPDESYFTLYAVDQITDETGMVTQAFLFAVQEFRIQPAVNLSSPCAIEIEGPYPGLHITAFPTKEREQTGITDPTLPGQNERDVQRVLTADQRLLIAMAYQELKAITGGTSFATYGAIAGACVEDDNTVDPSLIPPANCIGETSNARRLELCRAAWAADPLHYEGTDRSLTAPLNGELYGLVQGTNPSNGAPLGGSGFFVDEVLDFDAYTINWQYADLNGDGQPDYPASVPADQRSPTGFSYLSGLPISITRGVTNVPLSNRSDSTIAGQMSIFADIGDDSVNF
jgi:hypothetical protein